MDRYLTGLDRVTGQWIIVGPTALAESSMLFNAFQCFLIFHAKFMLFNPSAESAYKFFKKITQ